MKHALAPAVVSLAAGAVAIAAEIAFAPAWLSPMVRAVAVYDAVAIALLAWYWQSVLRNDPARTKARAAAQDPGRNVVTALIFAAAAFGFAAAFAILGQGAHDAPAAYRTPILTVGFAAVVLGWLLIHTLFLFRYAHAYYRDRNKDGRGDRGLIFPGDREPSDIDFAYFSFVLGMTFQVSDVQITDSTIRREALIHGLVSFAYNTAILALVVNVVSNLLH